MSERTKIWIRKAGIRAIKTMAQTAVAMIGTAAVMAAVDWRIVLSASILSGILSLCTSVAGLPEVEYELADIEDIKEEGFEEEGAPDEDQ